MSTPIRVLVCDDHALLRSGLRLLLEAEPDLQVVGEAGDAEEAVERARALAPDVVILDIVLPGRSGIQVLPDIRSAVPGVRVLVVSMQDDPHYVRAAFAAGASGYLPKEAADVELVQAIREVAAGHRFVHPAVGARLAVQAGAVDRSGEASLSERERTVLRLLALGHTNHEIAQMLAISVRTVETHRAHVLRKLGLKTRADIVRYAASTGFLWLPEADAPPVERTGG
jgi:two-component system response regulator NreC